MSFSERNTIFKPILAAGIIIIVFGGICLWISQIIQLKEEGEGFIIIGVRFIIGGIGSDSFCIPMEIFCLYKASKKKK